MDVFVFIAIVAIILLFAELLLPTGGVLAGIGALGLVGAGVYALTVESDSNASAWAGPGLVTLGILALIAAYVIGRKVLAAHRDEPVRTGSEELIGARAEVRASLDPEGQVFVEGAIWAARLRDSDRPLRPGDRVTIEAVDGLTLIVRPSTPTDAPEQGAV